MKERKQSLKNQMIKNTVNISYHLHDPKKNKGGDGKAKKIKFIQQLDIQQTFNNKNSFVPISLKKSHNISQKENNNKKIADKKKKMKKSFDESKNATFRKKNQTIIFNKTQQNPDFMLSTKIKKTRRSNPEIQRLGKSLDYKKYFNKNQVLYPQKQSKSQTTSPKKKSVQRQMKKINETKHPKNLKARPSSVRTSTAYNNTLYTQQNKGFNKTQHSHRLKQMIKLETQNLKEIKQNLKEFAKYRLQKSISPEKKSSGKKVQMKKKSLQYQRKPIFTTTNRTIKNQTKQQNQESSFGLISRIKTQNKKGRKNSIKQPFEIQTNQNVNKCAGSSIFQNQTDHEESLIFQQSNHQIQQVQLTEIDEINLIQLRQYEIGSQKNQQKKDNEDSLIFFNEMAKRIQRCWRKYKTRKLLQTYIELFSVNRRQHVQNETSKNTSNQQSLQKIEMPHAINPKKESESLIKQINEYESCIQHYNIKQQLEQQKITIISNLEGSIEIKSSYNSLDKDSLVIKSQRQKQVRYEEMVKLIKQQELEKWNQIIKIISSSLKSNQQTDTKLLLEKIVQQSKKNKKNLEEKKILYQQKKNFEEKEISKNIDEIGDFNNLSQSQPQQKLINKDPFSEFNSKKYKQLLDPNIIEQLVKSRQKVLIQRQRTEKFLINEKRQADEISQNTYKKHCQRIEKWVTIQRKNIQKAKKDIQMGLGRAKQAIRKTQLDYLIMQKLKGGNNKSIMRHSFSEQGLRRNIIHKKTKLSNKLNDKQLSENSSLKQYQYYIQNNEFQDYKSEQNYQTQQLKEKLEQIEKRQRSPNKSIDQSSEDERILKRQTNQPLHKIHFQAQQPELSLQTDRSLEINLALDLKLYKNANKLKEQAEQIILNKLVQEFLKQISSKPEIMTHFKNTTKKLNDNTSSKKIIKKVKGIKTDITRIRQYLNELSNFIINYHQTALANLEKPTGPTTMQMLRYMHFYQQQQQMSVQDEGAQGILANQIFDEFWKFTESKLIFQKVYPELQKEKSRMQYLKGLTRIFHRSIFDTFNECLDHQRNFGAVGLPFPWKTTPVFSHKKYQPTIYIKCLQNAKEKTLEIASIYCGVIFDKQQLTVSYPQDYIFQIQNDRMTKMISEQIIQTEDKWLFYDDQQTQILVELSELINQILITQACKQIQRVM